MSCCIPENKYKSKLNLEKVADKLNSVKKLVISKIIVAIWMILMLTLRVLKIEFLLFWLKKNPKKIENIMNSFAEVYK